MTKFLPFLLFLSAQLIAQAPSIQWQKCYGGYNSEIAEVVKQTSDGGYIAAGYTNSVDGDIPWHASSGLDFWVVKLNPNGIIQWQKRFGGSKDDKAYDIQPTSDGGYIVLGESISSDGDINDFFGFQDRKNAWIVKLTASGDIEWRKSYGTSLFEDQVRAIRQTPDGGYAFVGSLFVSGNGIDFWLTKISATGQIEWQKTYGGTGLETCTSIDLTADGGYILVGSTNSQNGDVTGYHNLLGYPDMWVIKTDALGSLQWQKTLGGSYTEDGYGIQQTPDGGYVASGWASSLDGDVTGFHYNGSYAWPDAWIVKLDALGDIQWNKAYGGTQMEGINCKVSLTADGGYVFSTAAGSYDGDVTELHGLQNAWIVKLNGSGTLLWQKTLGNYPRAYANCVAQTVDNGFIVSGYLDENDGTAFATMVNHHNGNDFYVVKLAADVLFTESFDHQDIVLYPNPTSGVLNVSKNGLTTVKSIGIYNTLGQLLLNTNSLVEISVDNFPCGNYFAKIDTGKSIETVKFIKN